MKKGVGIWIDHHRAVIVTATDEGEATQVVLSHIEKQQRRSDGHVSTSSEARPPDDKAQRAYGQHLSNYYDEVLARVSDAQAVWIFGPAEAKGELRKRFEKVGCGKRVTGIDVADKLTDRQIVATVRQYFSGRKAPTP